MNSLLLREAEPLKPYTTFKIGGPARYFASVESIPDLRAVLAEADRRSLPVFVLGGGSNVLVSDAGFAGVVLHPTARGIQVAREERSNVELEVSAAEPWDDLVQYAVERHWWGIENLSHIPGHSGAAVVQNIGAYGQQVSDVARSVEVLEVATGRTEVLDSTHCGFGYRRSIFNWAARGRYIILRITLRLSTRGRRQLAYPDLREYFVDRQPSLAEIRAAVIAIRDRKFPFPREERGGNAGSFFKNLLLYPPEFETLRARLGQNFTAQEVERLGRYRCRSAAGERIKIPTAFLIEICGLKGYRVGAAQVNESQPLVLLNGGGATSADVLALARHVRRTVHRQTGAAIEIEPELVGVTPEERDELLRLD